MGLTLVDLDLDLSGQVLDTLAERADLLRVVERGRLSPAVEHDPAGVGRVVEGELHAVPVVDHLLPLYHVPLAVHFGRGEVDGGRGELGVGVEPDGQAVGGGDAHQRADIDVLTESGGLRASGGEGQEDQRKGSCHIGLLSL